MRWMRLYSEARTDRKLAILTLAERGVWVNLLCYANEQEERGTFGASDKYVLAIECADGDEAMLSSTLDKLLRVKHLVELGDGLLAFRTFSARQYDKPSDSPEETRERKRKQRERQMSHDGDDMSRDVTRGHAPYIDSDIDSDSVSPKDGDKGEVVGGANAPADVGALSGLCMDVARAAGLDAKAESLRRLVRNHTALDRDALLLEAEKAGEYVKDTTRNKRKRKMSVAFLDNWLKRAEQPLEPVRYLRATGTNGRAPQPEPQPLPVSRGIDLNAKPKPLPVLP